MAARRSGALVRSGLLSLMCVAFAAALSAGALAEERAHVLLAGGTDPTFARRVRAEAEAAGLVVIEVAEASDASELLTQYHAPALIRLFSDERSEIHVLLADGAIVRTLARHGDDRDSFALRLVEEVYARLVELHLVEPRKRTEAAPAVVEPVRAQPAADRGREHPRAAGAPLTSSKLWLLGGLAGTRPAGAIGATVHGVLGVALEPARRVTLAARAFLPLTENNLVEREGSADVNVNLFIADAGYELFEPVRALSVGAGIGAGVLVLGMQGEAAAPLTGQEERTTAALGFAQASLAWSLAPWFRIRLGVLGGASAPRPVLRFAEREVAAWGRLFAAAALSSEFGLALSGPEAQR